MNRSQLVKNISNQLTYFSKGDVEEGIISIINFVSNNLSEGNRLEIRGFGSFSTRKRDARIARNPRTGAAINILAKYHPYFRASKSIKLDINK